MSISETAARVRSGVFHIIYCDAQRDKLGSGSAFLSNGLIVTNNHVYAGAMRAHTIIFHRDDHAPGTGFAITPQDFRARLRTGSDQNSYDYAALQADGFLQGNEHDFRLQRVDSTYIGKQIMLLGYPLDHNNMTCHAGIVSSLYASGPADMIQLDASVNGGNSGGPLIDPDSGHAIGIITRKATGLSKMFSQIKAAIQENLRIADQLPGGISIAGVDPVRSLKASQTQMLHTMNEIERQANVGIAYAISARHLLDEECLSGAAA